MEYKHGYWNEDKKIDNMDIYLTTISGLFLGQIPVDLIEEIKRTTDSPDEIILKIPKFIYDNETFKKKRYYLYDLFKNERKIFIDQFEIYVVKSITEDNEDFLSISAKSGEIRLSNIDVFFEDSFISFIKEDKDDKDILVEDLKVLLKEQTGWTFNTSNMDEDIIKRDRFLEGIDKKWYEFLTNDITDLYDCVVDFDTFNKIIYLYPADSGSELSPICCLSKDNYIYSLEKEMESDELITVLRVEGTEEMDISGSICTGGDYIENYSYFMKIGEMSEELITALEKYYDMIAIREPQWKKLAEEKRKLESQKLDSGNKFLELNSKKTALINVKRTIHDPQGKNLKDDDSPRVAKINADITKINDEIVKTKGEIHKVEGKIKALEVSIKDIVELCKKKTATNENGLLIFTPELLEELREYYYIDTYKNDAFLVENVDDLIKVATKHLKERCEPTKKWEIGIDSFKKRIIYKGSVNPKTTFTLGDVVILYDSSKDEEEFVFITACNINPNKNTLSLTLSNKRNNRDNGLIIADYLSQAKNAMRTLDQKRYLLNQQKYKRINVPREFIPKYKEKKKPRPDGTIID